MRLFEFESRTLELNKDVNIAMAEIQANCGQAILAARNGNQVFKGMEDDGEFFEVDPKLYGRRSANTRNYYTTLFDNLESWKGYPKRSRSLICTTSSHIASGYGSVFLVIPFDGARFGVCPRNDIWSSFSKLVLSLDSFCDYFYSFGINEDSFEDMLEGIVNNRQEMIDKSDIAWQTRNSEGLRQIIQSAVDVTSLKRELNKILGPRTNGFELASIGNLPSGREVWTDSKSYLIRNGSLLYQKVMGE